MGTNGMPISTTMSTKMPMATFPAVAGRKATAVNVAAASTGSGAMARYLGGIRHSATAAASKMTRTAITGAALAPSSIPCARRVTMRLCYHTRSLPIRKILRLQAGCRQASCRRRGVFPESITRRSLKNVEVCGSTGATRGCKGLRAGGIREICNPVDASGDVLSAAGAMVFVGIGRPRSAIMQWMYSFVSVGNGQWIYRYCLDCKECARCSAAP